MTTANELVRAARTRLSASPTHACLAAALWSVKIVEDAECQSNGQPTMGVSEDWTLYYHPDVAAWPLPALETVWLHEIWHLLRSHAARAKAMGISPVNHQAWNVAADMEINDGLVESHMPFPPGMTPCLPAMIQQPNGLLAEEYYNKLPKDNSGQGGQGKGKGKGGQQSGQNDPQLGGSGADGQARPWEKDGGSEAGQAGKPSQKRVIQGELIRRTVADAIQRQQGNMPGSWKRWAGKVLTPKSIPWEIIIRATMGRLVTAGKREDYTYSRPARRDLPGGFVMPGQFGTLPEIAVGVDTSGSMADTELEKAISIIESVLEYHGRTNPVTVISGDTCVSSVKRTLQAHKVELTGGGGTDMRELIKHAETLRPKPAALVLVTDGYTPWPERQPAGMQLVVLLVPGGSDGSVPKWATVVHLTK